MKHRHLLPPAHTTEPFRDFIRRHWENMRFVNEPSVLVRQREEMLKLVVKELAMRVPNAQRKALEAGLKTFKRRTKRGSHYLERFRNLQLETLLCRAVDNYLSYITGFLSLIFLTRPETLKSGETVRLDFILNYKHFGELIAAISEQRVHQLSYKSMRELNQYMKDKLGFELLQGSDNLASAVNTIELRNLLVHNRGVVNRVFVERSGIPGLKIGAPAVLDWQTTVFPAFQFIGWSAVDIERRGVEKFTLPTPAQTGLPVYCLNCMRGLKKIPK